MATGLSAGLSDDNNEWVLDFSNFRSASERWLTHGEDIIIAHPDTGWTLHPELVAPTYRRDLSRNFFDPIKNGTLDRPYDAEHTRDNLHRAMASAHGTGTAGVIVSPPGPPDGSPFHPTDQYPERDPRAYVSGAAPRSTVIPFRVTDNPLMGDDEDTALTNCIYYCIGLKANMGIDVGVMSISLGGTRVRTEHKIKSALVQARQAGIIMIAAAGQLPPGFFSHLLLPGLWGKPSFPGSSPDTICAAGCDWHKDQFDLAFEGKEVAITAPAVNVWIPRTFLNEDEVSEGYRVERSDGTSYATALTAAACALWQSRHGRDELIAKYNQPKLHTVFKYCLQQSADRPAGWDTDNRGAGVLDVEALLSLPLPSVELVDELFFQEPVD